MAATSPTSAGERLEADLDRLGSLDVTGLRRCWRKVFGRPPPEHLTRALLHRALAYRVQANALGDLDRETARMLDRLVGLEVEPVAIEVPGIKPGTLLVREWEGALQRVTVLEKGFAWNGATYDSLSAVAYAVTGTRWNGPRFFGLRGAPKPSDRRPKP